MPTTLTNVRLNNDTITRLNAEVSRLQAQFPGANLTRSDVIRIAIDKYLKEVSPMTTLNGRPVDYAAAINLMDDDLREAVHADLAPCTDQEFLDEYARRHLEKYGEEFRVD